jgi:hypothetical protein
MQSAHSLLALYRGAARLLAKQRQKAAGPAGRRVSRSRESPRWTEEVLMEFLPTVIQAEYRGDFKICVTFNDGVVSTIDFAPRRARPGPLRR